jgi:hypothetical protein
MCGLVRLSNREVEAVVNSVDDVRAVDDGDRLEYAMVV